MQFPDALMICVLAADLAQLHNVVAINREGILKAVEVPILEQGEVKAHMRSCEPVVGFYIREKCVKMSYIVHGRTFDLILNPSPAGEGFITVVRLD